MFIHFVITEYAGQYMKLPTRFPHQVNSDTFAQAFQRAMQIEGSAELYVYFTLSPCIMQHVRAWL